MEGKELPLPLPRGCTEVKPITHVPVVNRILRDRENREAWERRWGAREGQVQAVFDIVVRGALMDSLGDIDLREELGQIDSDTGLSHRTLLAQGSQDLRSDRYVVTTANRIGISMGEKSFCQGGEIHFKVQMGNSLSGFRKAEGDFIGIVLNPKVEGAKPMKEDEGRLIDEDQAVDIVEALILARKAMVQAEKEGTLKKFFTQEEFDRATDWVIFNER